MNDQLNINRIKAVYFALGALGDKVVFVGGATVALYATRQTLEVRPTNDVDIVVEIYTKPEYAKLEEQLRSMGFQNDTAAKFVGRFIHTGITVDVMPILDEVLGFKNQWYDDGYKSAINFRIDDQCTVKIFQAPYFIASKLEAFKSRGKNEAGEYDGRTSTDFEDLVYVMENRSIIWEEMEAAPPALSGYLKAEFKKLLESPYLEEWIDSSAGFSSPPMTSYILDKMKAYTQ